MGKVKTKTMTLPLQRFPLQARLQSFGGWGQGQSSRDNLLHCAKVLGVLPGWLCPSRRGGVAPGMCELWPHLPHPEPALL